MSSLTSKIEAIATSTPAEVPKPDWESIALKKQEERAAALRQWDSQYGTRPTPDSTNVKNWPINHGGMTERETMITESIPSELIGKLAAGALSAEETLRAFITRTIIAQHLTNPVTEVLFERGLERAKELDRHLKRYGETVGPFHGLPISLKDVMNILDVDTTTGYVAWVGKKPKRADTLVELLWQGGAVFYCKTNVPQTLMSGECFNFLFGRTVSPWNTTTSAGGSSGGEGSLVSLGGSPLGVGSDIAGSINTPANHNGIYGLCPSTRRLPLHGSYNAFENLSIVAVAGPLSRSIDGLEVYVKGVLELEPWKSDATCLRIPWDQEAYEQSLGISSKLCFGFIHDDGVVTPHPPIQRGMRETAEALKRAGHSVIELPSFFETVADQLDQKLLAILNALGGEEIRKIVATYEEPLSPEIVLPRRKDTLSLESYLKVANEILVLRQKYLEKYSDTAKFTSTGRPVDVLILPSGGHVSPPHGKMGYLLYEAISNLLDWTCGTIPVGFVSQDLDKKRPDHKFVPRSEEDTQNWEMYSPEIFKDVPVCLQVLGQRHDEEKVLGCMRAIDRALGRSLSYRA